MSGTIVGRTIEERIGHIEGMLGQMDKRLNSFGVQLRDLRSRIWWLVGIVIGTWITTIGMLLTILLKVSG